MSLSFFTDNPVATNKVTDEIEHLLAFLGSRPRAKRPAGSGSKQIFIPDGLACQNRPELVDNLAGSDLQACLLWPRYFVAKSFGLLSRSYNLISFTIDAQSFRVGNKNYVAANSHYA
jgi:hypothetical protein